MNAAERKEILTRYMTHSQHFAEVAARRPGPVGGEVIELQAVVRSLERALTRREVEVLQLISDGLMNREIGERLFLSEETIKSHVQRLLAKLQVRSRAHAVAVGLRHDLIA